jgi:hypothetical protein
MKNIHILPTEKPSRLYKHNELGFELLAPIQHEISAYNGSNQHIYITSDEEIKRYGEYYLDIDTNEVKTSFENMGKYLSNEKKIILTTDPDLIKDGVQAIDDEFLEWFVKNPSCEFVEVENQYRVKSGTIQEHKDGLAGYEYYEYKIIIPQEEPKQEMLNLECKDCNSNLEVCTCTEDTVNMKQETLEEANWKVLGTKNDTFYNGAKWQAERMYSEEEVHNILKSYKNNKPKVYLKVFYDKWFEQFKKK